MSSLPNSGPAGLMFHHFHGEGHPEVQGSIDAETFRAILHKVGRDNILPAKTWQKDYLGGTLSPGKVCITFDDALRCQYDIAKPVLDDLQLSGFWFVYSSVFRGVFERLEIYRYFRTVLFDDIDHFYKEFFNLARLNYRGAYDEAHAQYDSSTYLLTASFYSENDKWFRYLRDIVLGPGNYHKLMATMIKSYHFDEDGAALELWLTADHLIDLHQDAHVIGLHSDSHPTAMAALTRDEQIVEYQTNFRFLSDLLGEQPTTMSHPCNSYTAETLELLGEMGIRLGFRADMEAVDDRCALEVAREDHANLVRLL
jgi:peptidoglycan/xylan/chitin deacetylase (PgdA/CDA1 family)